MDKQQNLRIFKRYYKNLLSAYLKEIGLKHYRIRDGESSSNSRPNWKTLRIYVYNKDMAVKFLKENVLINFGLSLKDIRTDNNRIRLSFKLI